ncbi:hypothetical protein IWW51_004820, partial [Coemansia sp. RSA 2702]
SLLAMARPKPFSLSRDSAALVAYFAGSVRITILPAANLTAISKRAMSTTSTPSFS